MTSLIRKAMNKFSTSSFGWRYDCNTSSQEDSYHSFFSRSNSRSEAAIRPVQKSSSNCNRKSHSSSRVSKHLVVHKSRLMRSTAEKPYVRTKRNPCAQNYQKQKPLDDTRSAVASATKAAILTKSSLPIFSTTLDQKSIQEDIATRSMAYIYADIHAASTPGVIPQTFDLVPMNPQSKGFCQESWIYSNLALQTREMLKVIEYACFHLEHRLDTLAANIYAVLTNFQAKKDRLSRAVLATETEILLCTRYGLFATTNGWMMLSILANSASFREAARTFNVASWKSLENRVRINADSIEYFAKVRGLNWKLALETTARIFPNAQIDWNEKHPGIPIDHPHHYIVPQGSQSLQRPKYKNQNQINIARCDFFRSDFRGYSRPSNWPAEKPYPSDPTISNEPCELCLMGKCACEITDSPEVLKPLVELQRYGNKGIGIRALQRFEPDEILGEYVGEILPWDFKDDPVYGMSFAINDTHIAMISSQFRGNWTRFLNHSCDSNTEFTYMTIGGRKRIMVVAVKPVEMFEELTVDYGGNYFQVAHGIFCICGSPKCRYKKSPN